MSSRPWQSRLPRHRPTEATKQQPLSPAFNQSLTEPSDPLLGCDNSYDSFYGLIQGFNTENAIFHNVRASHTTIGVQVGVGAAVKTFTLDAEPFYNNTGYTPDSHSSKNEFILELPQYDPVVFELFVEWLKNQDQPILYKPNEFSDEPWLSLSAHACILGQKLQAHQFEAYALSQFITNCALSELITWELIEREVSPGCTIRRFSNHWVAWNCYILGAEQSEYHDLTASGLSLFATEDTRDPRIYELDHWYSTCGKDLDPFCSHDPIFKINQQEEAKRVQKPVSDWGRDLECDVSSINKDSTTSRSVHTRVPSRPIHPMRNQRVRP